MIVPERRMNMSHFKGLTYIQQELRDIRIEVRTENNQPGGYPVIVFKKDDLPGFEYVLQEDDHGNYFGLSPTDPQSLFMKIQEFKNG